MRIPQICAFAACFALLSPLPSWAVDFDLLDTPYVTSNVHTETVETPFPHFETFDDGPKTVFAWDEQPFYSLKYTLNGITDLERHDYALDAVWKFDGDGSEYLGQNPGWCIGCNGMQTTSWGSIPDWASNRTVGNWALDLTWNMDGGDAEFFQTFSFHINAAPTVTPEPASMLLFSLGGASLALFKRRRK